MFESLIRQATERFPLGGSAGPLVKSLVDSIFDEKSGGFAGLRDRFTHAGLGDLFSSWIGGSPDDNALQPDQFAAGFGSDAIGGIAGKLGLPASAVSAAGAFLLPKLVGGFTAGGNIPSGRPGGLDALLGGLSGLGDNVRNLGGAAVGAAGAAAGAASGAARDAGAAAGAAFRGAGNAVGNAGAAASDVAGGGMGFLKWLLPLVVVLGLGYWLLHRNHGAEEMPAATTPATADVAPAAEAPAADAAAADTMAAPAADATAVPAADAAVPAEADANAAADAALSGVKAGASVDDVLKGLNLMIIHFATGSANISADSDAILTKAAAAIKSLPAGTKLEVGGHTDNTGNAAKNQTLSQQRADAVVARLGELGVTAGSLAGKGYGQDKPKADNSTAEGRAQNRRIEFTATQ